MQKTMQKSTKKVIIITRAIEDSPDSENIRALINNSNLLKIAINYANVVADIRLFLDFWLWKDLEPMGGKMMTRSQGMLNIPKWHHRKFIFFNMTKQPCSPDKSELLLCNSSLDTSIDLAYKMGTQELLLVADNNIVEDGVNFLEGFCESVKKVTNFYNDRMNLYQFGKGNLDLPVKSVESFVNIT